MVAPVLAICTHSERVRYGAWDDDADVVDARLVRAAQAAGARVLLIPHDDALVDDPRQALALVDGVVAETDGDRRNGDAQPPFPEAFAARAEREGTPVLRIAPEPPGGDGAGPAEAIARFVAGLRR